MSHLLVDLDTRGPMVSTDVLQASVTPPSDGLVLVFVSEPLGSISARVVDAMGGTFAVGVEQIGDLAYGVLIPGVNLVGGPAQLLLDVTDDVGNPTHQVFDFYVNRDTTIRISLETQPSVLVETRPQAAFSVEISTQPWMLLEVRTALGG